jgi:hypothetical protein
VQYDELLLLFVRLLSRMVIDVFGLHPLLSAGVLLPLMFRAMRKAEMRWLLVEQAAALVALYTDAPMRDINLRPIIPAPAAARAVQDAMSQTRPAHMAEMVPIDSVDSDSLCIISSFLCGCDFLRVIRVCRRWSGLRLKPVAWPSPQPCDTHTNEHVATFYPMFEDDLMFPIACHAFHQINAAGVRRLLDLGVLDYLLPHLEEASVVSPRQSDALELLQHIGRSHAAVLVSGGILSKLCKLLRCHPDDFRRARVCAVLAVVLHGCTSAEVDSVVQGGLIPALFAFASRHLDTTVATVQVLVHICLRGNDAHRREMVVGGALPLFVQVVQQWTLDSAAMRPEQHDQADIDIILHLLRALSLLLRTATALDAKVAVVSASAAAAARTTKVPCISRVELEPLLEHWHTGVRSKASELLREHFN